jgi:hypothetical protein
MAEVILKFKFEFSLRNSIVGWYSGWLIELFVVVGRKVST